MGNLKELVENTNAYNLVSKIIAQEPVVIVNEEQVINEQVQDCMSWIMQLNEDFNNDVIDEETYYAQLEEGFGNFAKNAWNTTNKPNKPNKPKYNPVNAPSPKGRVSNPSQAQNRYNQGAQHSVDKSKESNYNNVSYQKNQQMSNQRSQMQRPRFAQ